MKHLVIIALAAMLLLSACSVTRQKLSPQGNVNLKTANVYYAQQNVEAAMTYYQLVLEDNPNHALALRRVADINLYNGERFSDLAVDLNKAAWEGYDKSIKIMEQYEKLSEDEAADIRDMKKRRTSAWTRIFKAGEEQAEAGNTQRAIEIFELVAALDTSRIEPLIKLKTIYQVDLKDDDKAEEILLKIYAKDQNDPLLLQEMGIFYMNKKDYAAALPFFESVKVREPLNVNNLMNLSFCQFELGQYEAAKLNTQLVLEIEPLNPDALSDAKYIAYKLADNAGAVGYLKRLLDIRDNDADYQEISFLLNEMKNYEEMITYARKWHNYDETNKDAVRLVILGAQLTNNTALATQYQNILNRMN
ncbi:MAG: tetratricopeptide repeat protein [Candidatus Syntrophosphaera sp.]|nr:tetratricopeptide repeat protein [Candidatus Syntrophosphaera sp.]